MCTFCRYLICVHRAASASWQEAVQLPAPKTSLTTLLKQTNISVGFLASGVTHKQVNTFCLILFLLFVQHFYYSCAHVNAAKRCSCVGEIFTQAQVALYVVFCLLYVYIQMILLESAIRADHYCYQNVIKY